MNSQKRLIRSLFSLGTCLIYTKPPSSLPNSGAREAPSPPWIFHCVTVKPESSFCWRLKPPHSESWHLPVAEKQADLCHSARRSHSVLSKAAGNFAPPLGLPVSHHRVSLDWQPPWEFLSSPGYSVNRPPQSQHVNDQTPSLHCPHRLSKYTLALSYL